MSAFDPFLESPWNVDCMGEVVNVGDTVACATNKRIWVGEVIALPFGRIKFNPLNSPKKSQTLEFDYRKIWRVDNERGMD